MNTLPTGDELEKRCRDLGVDTTGDPRTQSVSGSWSRAAVAWLVLAFACSSTAQNAVTPGEVFAGPYLSVKAPNSSDWQLQSKSDKDITFAKGVPGNTFIASVLLFRLAPATTPGEFEALIKEGAARDTDPEHPDRYELLEQSVVFSNERPYPCARYRAVSVDKLPKGTKEPQFLELDGLYCRHPMDSTVGAVIMYSHRGLTRHSTLRQEAESFIENAQLATK